MCECHKKLNGLLEQYNTKLTLPIFGPQRVIIETMKIDDKKRTKPKVLFATFCPFCGIAYPEPEFTGVPARTSP